MLRGGLGPAETPVAHDMACWHPGLKLLNFILLSKYRFKKTADLTH